MRDTIFASATGAGRSAVAVVRISGPETGRVMRLLAGRTPAPRRATLRRLRSPDGASLDQALTLWFPAPGSYTGEDCAELHLHGGPAIVAGVAKALCDLGLRLAEPGEFTRRAFEAGKLDLDQAEAVADLIDAETEAQAQQGLAQLGGALGRRYGAWRDTLTEALARLEAAVDFPDEDLPEAVADQARPILASLIRSLEDAAGEARRGEAIREGYRVAIIGAPNAGKSSLLNALLRREAAIVTETPGTTRDVIEAGLVVGGYKVVIADMAGLRAASDPIEAEGVRRARDWAEAAALRLWVADASASDGAWRAAAKLARPGDLLLLNKSDLTPGTDAAAARAFAGHAQLEVFAVAVKDGADQVEARIGERVAADLVGAEMPAVTRQRHGALLTEALAHLRRAVDGLTAPELAAEDLRLAARALGRVAGRVGAEDVLDRVFASFCIGK